MTASSSAVKKLKHGLIIGLTGSAFALLLWMAGWLDVWEFRTWDWRASLLAKSGSATDSIVIIKLDQNSLDWGKKESGWAWPWPREVYAAIVDYCRRSGAKAVAFDVLFTEPSREGVSDDEILGTAMSQCGNVAASLFLGHTTGSEIRWPPELTPPEFPVAGLNSWLTARNPQGVVFSRATVPIPEVARSSAILCNVHLEPDRDGIYRRIRLFGIFDNKTIPSLGLGAYLAANLPVLSEIGTGMLQVDNKSISIDHAGSVILRYRGPFGTYKTYSAAEVLQSELRIRDGERPPIQDKDALRGKYVFFGFTAPGLLDLRSSPVGGVYPGVEIHATALDNFLSGDFIRVIPTWLMMILVIALGLVCALSISFFSSATASVLLSAFFTATPIAVSIASYGYGYWLPLVVLEVVAVTTIAVALVVNYATEGRQKRFIKSAFKQYLSHAVIEELIQKPESLKLGGERKVLSIFFSDLQGFTSISEGLTPEKLASFLNDYLTAMTDIVQEEGGTVDKYEGDAIIAFWNAPLEIVGHAGRAVRAALRCQARLAEMRPTFRERIGADLYMRIGINTGPAIVGNLGSHTRFDYTMIGDAVNLAARLEGVNKQFGTYTIISGATVDELGDEFRSRELARLVVVGRREPVTVYEPMTCKEFDKRRDVLGTFARGLALFYQGEFGKAQEVFSTIQNSDPPADAYVRKCRDLEGLPPDGWQGVWVMSSK